MAQGSVLLEGHISANSHNYFYISDSRVAQGKQIWPLHNLLICPATQLGTSSWSTDEVDNGFDWFRGLTSQHSHRWHTNKSRLQHLTQ